MKKIGKNKKIYILIKPNQIKLNQIKLNQTKRTRFNFIIYKACFIYTYIY